MSAHVGVLGAGIMGQACVRALLRAGHEVTVWNRTPQRAADLGQEGAAIAPSAVDVLRTADVTVSVVAGYEVVRAALQAAADAGLACDVINMTSGTPSDADELATWAKKAPNLCILEGAIMAFPPEIGSPEAMLLCSGSPRMWEQWRDVLLDLGGGTEYLGEDVQLANVVDCTILTYVTGAEMAALEALAYGKGHGMEFGDVAALLAGASRSLTGFVSYAAAKLEQQDMQTSSATIDIWAATAQRLAVSAASRALPASMVCAARDALQQAQRAGMGSRDLVAVLGNVSRNA